jgi:hypothetical protein
MEVILQRTFSRPIRVAVRDPLGAHYQILITRHLRFCSFGAPSLRMGQIYNSLVQLLLGFACAITLDQVPQTHVLSCCLI